MKREWRNIPDPIDFAMAWFLAWAIPAMLVIVLTWHNLPNTATTTDRHALSMAGWLMASIWLGPIVLGFIAFALLCVWDARPHREWIPLVEDAREADRSLT